MDLFKRCLALSLAIVGLALPAYGKDAPAATYQVVKGDCLWKIAAQPSVFGDPWKWPLIYQANPQLIRDPDLIQPGWDLSLPAQPTAAQVAWARDYAQAYQPGRAVPLPSGPAVEKAAVAKAQAEAPAPAAAAPAEATAAPPTPAPESRSRPWLGLGIGLLGLVGVLAWLTLRMRREAGQQAPSAPRITELAPVSGPSLAVPPPQPPAPPAAVPPVAPAPAPAPLASTPLPAAPQPLPTASEEALRADAAPASPELPAQAADPDPGEEPKAA